MARRISPDEWKRHEDTIRHLYHGRRLPLYSKTGGESVKSIMEAEHQFTASRSQYEAHFRSRYEPKNFKKEEWRAVNVQLRELEARGLKVRVKLSGKVLSEKQRRRKTRNLGPPPTNPGTTSEGNVAPRPSNLVIEIEGENHEWTTYTGNEVTRNTVLSSPINSVLSMGQIEPSMLTDGLENHSSRSQSLPVTGIAATDTLNHTPSQNYTGEDEELSMIVNQSQHFPPLSPDWQALMNQAMGFEQMSGSMFEDYPVLPHAGWNPHSFQYWDQESPFSQLHMTFLSKAPGNRLSTRETPTALALSLLREVPENRDDAPVVRRLPGTDELLENLFSLLPEALQVYNDQSEDQFYIALLYSIANGFAGLADIPSGAILRMLREKQHMSLRIIECLKTCPPAQAKCLGDNLFRAAVESCDEDAVMFILRATKNSPNAIDPNKLVCQAMGERRLFTPIELAAKFRHLGIVKILLAADADVNKTCVDEYGHYRRQHAECGALELAVRKWGDFEEAEIDMELLRTLLNAGAEVRTGLIVSTVRWGQGDLVEELLSRLPPTRHSEFFSATSIYADAEKIVPTADFASQLPNERATGIIANLLKQCEAEHDLRCAADNSDLMELMLCHAARRENVELVKLLLPYMSTLQKSAGLSAAVWKGHRSLIDLLLAHHASVSGPPCHLHQYPDAPGMQESSRKGGGFKAPSTPLAEAIRSQDNDLVDKFEKMGALSRIHEELRETPPSFYATGKKPRPQSHFMAAIMAAAEVGYCKYIAMLLRLQPYSNPKLRKYSMHNALVLAIRKNQTQAALLLLDCGADVNISTISVWGDPLLEALDNQNKTLVNAILDRGIDMQKGERCESSNYMLLAERWGDESVILDLVSMGASGNRTRLTRQLISSVEIGDKNKATEQLNNGASPNLEPEAFYTMESRTALNAAVINEDIDMIQLLINHGANLWDVVAFESAMDMDGGIFDTLCHALSSRHPICESDGSSFIRELIKKAIARGNISLLEKILDSKFASKSLHCLTEFTRAWSLLGDAIDLKTESVQVVETLIKHVGPNSRVCIQPQKTALLHAIERKKLAVVELLLQKGADAHQPARRGLQYTPLQQACKTGSFRMVKLILDYTTDVNEQPAQRGGATALQLAAISGSIKIAELLLQMGAMVLAPPARFGGKTAFEGAAEHGRLEMLRLLWNAVYGIGFMSEELDSAKELALSRGHRGCAEYIDGLKSLGNGSVELLT
ncbi:hypothetical protein HYFRA_00013794 [Hymenoscyphus fraxineus]|uniref:Clr5 domain-containing protein n=1 Tax=Hymenoscyphus fraxineus TaxID=746836 RepID=A0A9N9LB91_9HELO|nr:hypothetical protein HYFRA_00013794 [Hymenoscyphus fraxineus]